MTATKKFITSWGNVTPHHTVKQDLSKACWARHDSTSSHLLELKDLWTISVLSTELRYKTSVQLTAVEVATCPLMLYTEPQTVAHIHSPSLSPKFSACQPLLLKSHLLAWSLSSHLFEDKAPLHCSLSVSSQRRERLLVERAVI